MTKIPSLLRPHYITAEQPTLDLFVLIETF